MRTYTTGVTAVHLGGARVRFICPQGHETVRDYGQGHAGERLSETAAERLALAWHDRIRLPFTCRKCASPGRTGLDPALPTNRGRVRDPPRP